MAAVTSTNGTIGVAAPGRQTYKIALIPGDGIGIEVIAAGKVVLQHLAKCLNTFNLEFEDFEWSSAYYKKHGRYLPDDALEQMRKFNAILFGAVGAPGMCLGSRTFKGKTRLIYSQMFLIISPSGA